MTGEASEVEALLSDFVEIVVEPYVDLSGAPMALDSLQVAPPPHPLSGSAREAARLAHGEPIGLNRFAQDRQP